jgi:LPS sulfotransferase NodH
MNSRQAQDLVDRYEEIREILLNTDDGKAAWKSYNKKTGAHPGHDGYDLFA